MKRYNKFWAALLGAGAIALHESGVIDAGQADALMAYGLPLLTAFGVYAVPNIPR